MALPTIGELKNWAKGDYQRMIALAIATNGRDVYDYLKNNKLLGARWAKGYEQVQANRKKMTKVLVEAAMQSGNPMSYTAMFVSTLPSPVLKGNVKAQSNVRRLLIENP